MLQKTARINQAQSLSAKAAVRRNGVDPIQYCLIAHQSIRSVHLKMKGTQGIRLQYDFRSFLPLATGLVTRRHSRNYAEQIKSWWLPKPASLRYWREQPPAGLGIIR